MVPFEQSPLTDAGNLRAIVVQVMAIDDTTYGSKDEYAVRFRGQLVIDSIEAYARVAEGFRPLGFTPLFRKEKGAHIVYAVRGVLNPPRSNPWVNVVMLALTILSMLLAGGTYGYTGPVPETFVDWIPVLLSGWPFLISLLSILMTHELGHYFAARYHRVAVTLPYFIPFPFGAFGTFGAFIQLKAPPTNRRVLLDIGIAGPLAGFIVAVPIVLYGLMTSPVHAIPMGQTSGFEGNSILYILLKFLATGRLLPEPAATDGLPYALFMARFYLLGIFTSSGGRDVFLNQVAWAGWAGLLVTGLNLIPAGQLDGGHALYTLIGRRARYAVPVILVVLAALGFFWSGWWLWVALIFFLGRVHAEPLDQITELDPLRKVLAASALLLFLLVITPIPLS